MKQLIFIFFSVCLGLGAQTVVAQPDAKAADSENAMRVYRVNGEPIGMVDMEEVIIARKGKKRSGKQKRALKKLKKQTHVRWHVHKVYPYAVKFAEVLGDLEAEIENLPPDTKRRKYLKEKKQTLFDSYEDKIRKMSKTQGKVLVLLIHRETGKTLYKHIKDVKSGMTAKTWQSLATIYGININKEYDRDEVENWMIEKYTLELEAGGYNTAHKAWNFRL